MASYSPEQLEADAFNREFSMLNPQIPYNFKVEPVGRMNYLKELLRRQELKGGSQYVAPSLSDVPHTPGELPVDWTELNAIISGLHAEVAKMQTAIMTQLARLNAFVAAELTKLK